MEAHTYERSEHSQQGLCTARLGSLLFKLTLVCTALYSCLMIAILVSSVCAPWQLDYISTKLAQCLDINSTMLWVFMYCIQFQIFVLLVTWHRLCCRHDFIFHYKLWIVSCGVWFVISFCMVLEFRNDGNLPTRNFFFFPQMKESDVHGYAAVNTMVSFSALHVLLAVSLFQCSAYARVELGEAAPMLPDKVAAIDWLSRTQQQRPDTTRNSETQPLINCFRAYVSLDVIYLLTVLTFICMWSLNVAKLTVFTMAIEWAVGFIGITMHVCALWQSNRLLDISFTKHYMTIDFNCKTLLSAVFMFVAIFLLLRTVPYGNSITHAQSSLHFWILVGTSYLLGFCLIATK